MALVPRHRSEWPCVAAAIDFTIGVMPRKWQGKCENPGCILHSGHDGECKFAEMEEEDYEVEGIIRQRVRKGVTEYLVLWKDWPEADATWEQESALEDAPEALERWKRRHQKQTQPAPPKPKGRPLPRKREPAASAGSSSTGKRKLVNVNEASTSQPKKKRLIRGSELAGGGAASSSGIADAEVMEAEDSDEDDILVAEEVEDKEEEQASAEEVEEAAQKDEDEDEGEAGLAARVVESTERAQCMGEWLESR